MTASTPPPPSASRTVETRLLEHQLALVCRFSPAALRGGVVVAGLIAWVVSDGNPLWPILGWLAALTFVSVARTWLQSYYMHRSAELDVHTWVGFILAGLVINGLLWAVPAIWLVPPDPARQTVLAILSIGVAATAMSSLAPLRHAYAALLYPFMLPIAASYIWLDANFRTVALGIVLFVFAMLRIARRQHDAMSDLLRLQIDLQTQIEQRERTEAELRVAKADAEAASRAKSQFLANMSHELRTPLNGILGMSELLIRESNGKPLKHAQTVRNAGMRLLRIINDILDLSRMEAGALQMAPSEFSPRALTADVIELLSDHAAKKNIAVTATIDAAVPERAESDAGRIQQVLSNLVDNAIKFSERGAVQIVVTARALDSAVGAPRSVLRWEVRDSGAGIAADAQARLFKPFSQLDESATRKFGGTGLGLAISRQLVEALGGSIGLDSTLGVGSTFWFEVPAGVAAELTTPPATPPARGGKRGGRVLIVEDNAINRELVAEIVQAAGCTVSTANDGEQALAHIADGAFDLVLMDWHMPIMDGLSATRRLRIMEQAQGRPRLPVVALTASVLPGDREACEAAGMDDFVAKPFSYDELVALLDRWLQRS